MPPKKSKAKKGKDQFSTRFHGRSTERIQVWWELLQKTRLCPNTGAELYYDLESIRDYFLKEKGMSVSRATLKRDLVRLGGYKEAADEDDPTAVTGKRGEGGLGWPIKFDRRKKGYFIDGNVQNLARFGVEEEDLFGLLVLQPVVDQYEGTPIGTQLERTFHKLKEQMGAELEVAPDELSQAMSIKDTSIPKQDLNTLRLIMQAVQQCRFIDMVYTVPDREPEQYRLAPIHCSSINGSWYLYGQHKKSGGEIRNFKLTRITDVVIDQKAKPFPRQQFDIEDHTDWGIIKSGKLTDVEVRFRPKVAQFIKEKVWHRSQKIDYYDDGYLRLRLKLHSSFHEFEAWLRSWGAMCEVIKPKSLRKDMQLAALKMARNNGYEFKGDDAKNDDYIPHTDD